MDTRRPEQRIKIIGFGLLAILVGLSLVGVYFGRYRPETQKKELQQKIEKDWQEFHLGVIEFAQTVETVATFINQDAQLHYQAILLPEDDGQEQQEAGRQSINQETERSYQQERVLAEKKQQLTDLIFEYGQLMQTNQESADRYRYQLDQLYRLTDLIGRYRGCYLQINQCQVDYASLLKRQLDFISQRQLVSTEFIQSYSRIDMDWGLILDVSRTIQTPYVKNYLDYQKAADKLQQLIIDLEAIVVKTETDRLAKKDLIAGYQAIEQIYRQIIEYSRLAEQFRDDQSFDKLASQGILEFITDNANQISNKIYEIK